MKIESIRSHLLCHTLAAPFESASGVFHERQACLVEVGCDNGLVGWGECLGPARPNAAMIDAMAERIVGEDPLRIEPIWLALFDQFRDQGQHGITISALSGIDIALWDIAGKHFSAPVHVLLGGAYRDRVPAYATGGFRSPGQDRKTTVVNEVAAYARRGFGAVKIKIGFDLSEDAEVIAAVRAALGPDVGLMIDANHGYDTIEAIALGNRVAALGVDWFEEPVTPDLIPAYAKIRSRQPLPVAGGETWHGRSAFARVLAARAVDVLQPDVCGCGGPTEMRKIVAMAETAGVRVIPHVWGTAVAIAASLHMLAILPPAPPRHKPRAPLLEFDQTPNPLRQAVVTTPITAENGVVLIPQAPGLGIEINREALAHATVRE